MIFKQYECKREYKKYVYIFSLLLKNKIYFEVQVLAITYFLSETSNRRQKFVKDSNKHNLISELNGVVIKKKHR